MEPLILVKRVNFEDSKNVQAEHDDHQARNAVQDLHPRPKNLSEPRRCGAEQNESDRKPDDEHDRVRHHRSLQGGTLRIAFELVQGITGDLSLIHISEPTRLLSISYAVFCLK